MSKKSEALMGFSTKSSTTGPEYSWQVKKPPPPKPQIPPARAKQLDQMARQAIRKQGAAPPQKAIQGRTMQNTKFWKPADGGTPGGRKPTGGSGDTGKYGFPLPRYTAAYRASQTYQAGDKFDPKQTLFRHDPETLNIIAKEKHMREQPNKPFIPPHDTRNPVYEGFPDRKGATGFGRAWNHNRGNESGQYLFDMRNYNQQFQRQAQERVSRGEGVALRELFALPSEPTRISKVSIDPWSGSPDQGRKVKMSRTIGGGEQIIGNPDNFKFAKP